MEAKGVPNFYLGTVEDEREAYDGAPQDKINLGFSWQLIDELRLSGVSNYSREMNRLPEWQLNRDMASDAFQLHNLYLTYQPNFVEDLNLRVGVENLTNETYSAWPDAKSTTMPGRSYKVSMDYQF